MIGGLTVAVFSGILIGSPLQNGLMASVPNLTVVGIPGNLLPVVRGEVDRMEPELFIVEVVAVLSNLELGEDLLVVTPIGVGGGALYTVGSASVGGVMLSESS